MSDPAAAATPTVYFIDDSATMREVIKVAFRRENINVVACHDAATALSQIEESAPDVVITDVIMPDKDGYEVCQFIKQHPRLGKIPVILMSGVVNKAVAEKAFAVRADELIRKPFQPQDLITRVKHLLHPGAPAAAIAPAPASAPVAASAALSSIFATSQGRPLASPPRVAAPPRAPFAAPAPAAAPAAPAARPAATPTMDATKLRMEILRLEGLVKKLQAELEAEREYSRALEAYFKTLQGSE
ncbi:MAG: response regulator [Terriglobales bacterium]